LNAFKKAGLSGRYWVFEDSELGVASALAARDVWKFNEVWVVGVATEADQVIRDLTEFRFVTMERIYQNLVQGFDCVASQQLTDFLMTRFGLMGEELEFQNSEVSLNSFKGVFVAEGQRYFFKTHIELGGEVSEYAGAELLGEAGYPVVTPVFVSNEQGRELLVYLFVEAPSLFELVREGRVSDEVRRAQTQLDRMLFEIYKKTFQMEESPQFPEVQQLFYRRLAGGRFAEFYQGKTRELGGRMVSFEELEVMELVVNGVSCGVLGEWLARARDCLSSQAMLPFTVVGHGDAHNGNLFYEKEGLRYFDPAYAGRMDPFLDLAKPLFHNTWARWMYFPEKVEATFDVAVRWGEGRILIDHTAFPDEVEQFFFDSKMREVVGPLLDFLREKDCLPFDWQDRLRSALLCCPLLTVNLFDESRYSSAMASLGLARVAEMATFDFNPYLS